MGAWDSGIFDDDSAYDYFDQIEENPRAFFEASFQNAIEADYLEFDDCHAVTVSAAYLDNLFNGTTYVIDTEEEQDISNVNLFQKLYQGDSLTDLKPMAIQALEVVMGDKSELGELWMENEELYPQWKNSLTQIIDRFKQ